jgi:hypothetical protein
MARFSVRDIEPLELEFKDGTKKVAVFNNEAFIIYTEEFGDITNGMKNEIQNAPFEFGAKILYVGIKITEPNFTLDEARGIVLKGGWQLLLEIFKLLLNNFESTTNEETKKKFHSMLTEEMKSAMAIIMK